MDKPGRYAIARSGMRSGASGPAYRTLVVTAAREKVTRMKGELIQMDERAVRAHYKYVRGWKPEEIDLLIAHIEQQPASFNAKLSVAWDDDDDHDNDEDDNEEKDEYEIIQKPHNVLCRLHNVLGKY